MALGTYTIIILLSTVVIVSYLFSLFSKKTNIPSVLLLIATGIAIKQFSAHLWYNEPAVNKLVKILGAIGIIMIILEAALDLKITRQKVKLIRDSFSSALFIFLFSVLGIAVLIMQWLDVPFENSFLYAVPMSIISSAIVIPSTSHLPEDKKDFIIYESSFSDIIGILVFNYMIMKNILSLKSAMIFGGNVLLAVVISILATVLMIYILTKSRVHVKFFLLFAVLSLIYSLGEMIHLPSLLIVLVFGLVFNNTSLFSYGPMKRWLDQENIESTLLFMRSITAETSFLIRTFFFILFGYSINLQVLILPDVWQLGSLIMVILLFARFLYLRLILKTNLFPELFLMPRGLVTILLFYSIPMEKSLGSFNSGILFFVVAVSSLLMMIGLLLFKENKAEYHDKSEEVI
ncbi:MAG TPA: cation:proton antiporter [Flavipsychrobacter sp.]